VTERNLSLLVSGGLHNEHYDALLQAEEQS
jgi:hypothetical protein